MANGDKAAAKGMHVVAGTADRRVGYDDINIVSDELADEMDARALKLDAATIKIQQADPGSVPDGTVWIGW